MKKTREESIMEVIKNCTKTEKEYEEWKWKMDWCKKKKLPPASSTNWNQATEKYKEKFE